MKRLEKPGMSMPLELSATDLAEQYVRVKQRFTRRDTRMAQVMAVREGRMSEVAPDLFPDAGPWQEPIVANMIDVAARDIAEMLAPLPAFNCTSQTMVKTTERKRASEKTQVAGAYVAHSNLQVQMYSGADRYVTAGLLPFRVEPDYDASMPIIRVLDPVGSYPVLDRFGRVQAFFQRVVVTRDELITQFPEHAAKLKDTKGLFSGFSTGGSTQMEVVFYHDKDWDVALCMGANPFVLQKVRNPVGKVLVRVASRPGPTDVPRGQFDDVLFVQLAKARFALLSLQAAHDSVNAPLVVPTDVPEVPYGPGATIRTNNPGGVQRVPLEIPASAFAEQQALERELQLGSRFPEVRTGNTDSSIVTGKGVQALMGGYESQISAHQAVFARTLSEVVSLCFEMDEALFSGVEKQMRGVAHGTPYEITYDPAKVIKGDYTVDTRYGLMAGLDPNRWLVFGLQARAEKLFSRDFMMREMPVEIDVEEERQKIDIEDLEEAAKQALMGYAQSIPVLAANGQDPAAPVQALAKVIEGRRKGRAVSEMVEEVFTPEEPEPAATDPLTGLPMQPDGGEVGGVGALGANGLMKGVAPGQQGMAPGGRPDLNMMLAGLDARGNANLTAAVSRRQPV